MSDLIRIQFVCLGNICRSPLAEVVFRDKVEEKGLKEKFDIESSGTGDWHVGEGADSRMRQTADEFGHSLEDHRAQQFQAADLEAYDHVFVMDKSNLNDVLYFDEEDRHSGKVRLFREFDPNPGDYQVPDPYYGGDEGFKNVYDIVSRTSEVILERLIAEYDLNGEAN
ncbi:protein tyrosine phosphatase [Longibacter salinarum]|uniref:protein-tyrosine-phosphatase n=1 Tax=Longibacter salinarum TaxID=1850348 RepID=A0A2A8CYB3_9BACT|nr:low molecular weight protein-tyrosine-phosphatase [Longibacter salinarum]PEN13620.1 protein tyrosine phosphatase [Longibacter salinarum]